MAATTALPGDARIGPNAITQMAEVLRAELGEPATIRLFATAGLCQYLLAPPQRMVPERDVTALHHVLRHAALPRDPAGLSFQAGVRTADYLLAHRIPRPVQVLLKVLPAPLSSRLLLSAIGRHAWTFAGSGTFRVEAFSPARVSISDCPLCRGDHAKAPACHFYVGTFHQLYRTLVSPRADARETLCSATGGDRCVIEVGW